MVQKRRDPLLLQDSERNRRMRRSQVHSVLHRVSYISKGNSDLTRKVDQVIGKPYFLHAVGPDAFDCLGLVGHLLGFRVEFRAAYLRRLFAMAKGQLEPGDMLLWDDPRKGPARMAGAHVALYECGLTIVDSSPMVGVSRSSLSDAVDHLGEPRVFRMKPCQP